MIAYTFIVYDDTSTWNGYREVTPVASTSTNGYNDVYLQRVYEAYEKWLRSRNWATAPRVIRPYLLFLSKRLLFNLRIAPRF